MRRAVPVPALARSGRQKSRAGGAARAAGRGAGWPPALRARPMSRASPAAAGIAPARRARYRTPARRAGRGRPPIVRSTGRPHAARRPAAVRPGSRSRPFASGSRITALLSKTSATCVTATARQVRQATRGRKLSAHRVQSAVRRSRAPATRVCCRTLAISVAITMVTISITENVTRYCTSLTANVNRGGTKQS